LVFAGGGRGAASRRFYLPTNSPDLALSKNATVAVQPILPDIASEETLAPFAFAPNATRIGFLAASHSVEAVPTKCPACDRRHCA